MRKTKCTKMDEVGVKEGANQKVELLSWICWHGNHGQ
jgi:hypothetical protein